MTGTETGIRFPYQDPGLDVDQRVADLLARMTVEDKAGLMFQPVATIGELDAPGMFGMPSTRGLLDKHINHCNILQVPTARGLAEWVNAVQAEARRQPLGIPFTVSSDPRHSFAHNPGTAIMGGTFSQWPEMLGFGALNDPEQVERFADTVRREYLAVGIRLALHPQIDLATEPRWCRASATFGQDAEIAGRLGVAYVKGLQGQRLGTESVGVMAKHFPGGGPQKDGEDPHFAYGKEQVYPGGQLELHLQPFREVIAAGVAQMMPYYGVPSGIGLEEVAFSFNKEIITDLLREELGFDGVVCTDWSILSERPWGVEELTFEERMLKALDAGIDQFGGEFTPEVLVGLVRAGRVQESRLDVSVRRLLRDKFTLGLFDDPFVDVERADLLVGTAEAREAGLAAQSAAHTLLVNADGAHHLPLPKLIKVYAEGVDPLAFAGRADVVAEAAESDVAVLRLVAPWEPRGGLEGLEFFMHAGDLGFPDERIRHIREIAEQVPTVVDVYLERPAILTPFKDLGVTLIANFGASDEAFARVLFGEAEPLGRLPFQLPSSMEAVRSSRPDVPGDTPDPAFEFGDGLSYENWRPSPPPTDDDRAKTTLTRADGLDLATVTLGAVMDDPAAGPVLAEALPILHHLPMLDIMRSLPFSHVLGLVSDDLGPDAVEALKEVLSK
ncbi:glycoside hydrolase family 3 protein [Streptomyces echinatus]|uniref:beta-glucosidase n=1 Tax=Streptomyces echinatus TaxID=67293 RepID=A0A7W9PPN8_9ACTN|nr:glycoside hydrolase family 3 N-terminal domain-containing protein [Streptomyces echinatus]MBB5925645.1 beta-glucosidase [Streptomyces echinatus]